MLVDVHCHIDMCKRKAREIVSGGMVIVANGVNLRSNKCVLQYSKKFKNVYAAMGLYPGDAIKLSGGEVSKCLNFIKKNKEKIIGIGEVGVDFYHIKKSKEREKEIEIFNRVIKLANEVNLPLIVHSRKANKKIMCLLKKAKVGVLLHCFEGNKKLIEEGLKRGYYFSVPAIFWQRKQWKRTAKTAPLNRIITETDSPYLSPTESENRPKNVVYSIKKLSELKKVDERTVEKRVFSNFNKFFKKHLNINTL